MQCHIRAATDRLLKVYDKGKHQSEYIDDKNVFRIELRYGSNRAIQSALGHPRGYEVTIDDIITIEGAQALNARLLEAARQLMIVDTTKPQMNTKDFHKFKDYLTELHWSGLLESKMYAQRSRDFENFNFLVRKYGIDSIKNEIIQGLQFKLLDLHNCEKSHSKRNNKSVRNPTIDKTGISNIQNIKPSKCSSYKESHPDHPKNKKLRNDKSNHRNNKRRVLRKVLKEHEQGLFQEEDFKNLIHLNSEELRALEHWRGTKYDILAMIGF